jgi:hypothetical protein
MSPLCHPAKISRRPRSFDKEAYKGRNVVERCFNRLKQWRGIATRSDKTARSYLADVTLASALIWIKSGVTQHDLICSVDSQTEAVDPMHSVSRPDQGQV